MIHLIRSANVYVEKCNPPLITTFFTSSCTSERLALLNKIKEINSNISEEDHSCITGTLHFGDSSVKTTACILNATIDYLCFQGDRERMHWERMG